MAGEHEKFPSFNWFPRDWIAGTATLTAEQKGAFVDLLSYAWEQTPPCTLPDDDVALAKLGGIVLARWRKIGGPVRAKFRVCEDGRLRNPKQWLVYEDMVSFRQKKQQAGRSGNAVRWQRDGSATGLGIANGIADVSPPSPTPSTAVTDSVFANAKPDAVRRWLEAPIGGEQQSADPEPTRGELIAKAREHGFNADGTDADIIDTLIRKGVPKKNIAIVIEGFALLVASGGYPKPDEGQLSMRMLYSKKHGTKMPAWRRAEDAYYEAEKQKPAVAWGAF